MPRKPKEEPPYLVDVPPEADAPAYPDVHQGHYIDPLAPLPGPVKLVPSQRPPKRKPGQLQAAKGLYKDYVKALYRYNGNEVYALADVLGISHEEAETRKLDLHRSIVEPVSGGRSLFETLKELDLSKEARLAILHMHAYSNVPAASLAAIKIINDLDSGRAKDETSYEHYLRDLQRK